MGKSITPKYAMHITCRGVTATNSTWRGRPSEKRLRAHLLAYNASLRPGGVNARAGEMFGVENSEAVAGAIILNDGSKTVVCEVTL